MKAVTIGVQLMKMRFLVLGLILFVFGLGLTTIFYYFQNSVPLTAVGLSAILLGATCILLSGEKNIVTLESSLMMQTGVKNTTELLEELGIKNKAIYLPRQMRDGHPQALMPLLGESVTKKMECKLPGNLVIKNLLGSEIIALAVTTPGNISLDILPQNPGPTANEISESMTYILNKIMEIAPRVKVDLRASRINFEVKGVKKGEIDYGNSLFYQCLGSPIASIAAAVSSEALVKPVRIINESNKNGTWEISLEVLN
jgi:hypothetical protein